MDLSKLGEPFRADEYEWRIGQCGEKDGGVWAKALCYVTARAVQDRLDSVCGPANWRVSYRHVEGGVMCALSIRCGEEWITKEDGAETTEMEPFKGAISGALKRAAVVWGCGRLLYNLEAGWCECSTDTRKFPHYGKTKKGTAFSWQPPALPVWAVAGGEAQKPQEAPQKPAKGTLLTTAQTVKIAALVRETGVSDAEYRTGLYHHYQRDRTEALSRSEAKNLIERLEALRKAQLADDVAEAFGGDGRLGKLRATALGHCETIGRTGKAVELPGGVALDELREMIGASGDEKELEGVILKLEKLLEDMGS